MNKILFLGDLFFDYDNMQDDLTHISNFIKENNYSCILNLEGSIFGRESDKIKKRGPNLLQSEYVVEVLKKLNVIGVTLANNHIMDFGFAGLDNTIKMLNKNGIQTCGAGKSIEEALKPMCFEFERKKINIYNYGWNIEETVYATKNHSGCAPRINDVLLNRTINLNEINICVMHWGFEFNTYPQPYDIDLAHKLIDKGYNLIIGHHSHVIQSKEDYANKNIYYSLGNFYFGSRREIFDKKKYNGRIIDKSNYGLGLVYNVIKNTIEDELFFYYNSKTNTTNLIHLTKDETSEILTDISNVDINNSYIKTIKMTKKKKNPILTTNRFLNYCKIKFLFFLYSLLDIKKRIKHK